MSVSVLLFALLDWEGFVVKLLSCVVCVVVCLLFVVLAYAFDLECFIVVDVWVQMVVG